MELELIPSVAMKTGLMKDSHSLMFMFLGTNSNARINGESHLAARCQQAAGCRCASVKVYISSIHPLFLLPGVFSNVCGPTVGEGCNRHVQVYVCAREVWSPSIRCASV